MCTKRVEVAVVRGEAEFDFLELVLSGFTEEAFGVGGVRVFDGLGDVRFDSVIAGGKSNDTRSRSVIAGGKINNRVMAGAEIK